MTSQQGQAEFDPLPISCPARSVTCSGWGGARPHGVCSGCGTARPHGAGVRAASVSTRAHVLGLEKLTRVPLYDTAECPCCGLLGCFLCLLGVGGGARSGHWGVLESTMKLHPCLAEPILALHPHELTPPLLPNPVFSCFISAPSPERGGGAPGSAPGPDAADNPQAMRPRDRAGALCCFPPGRGHCRSCGI